MFKSLFKQSSFLNNILKLLSGTVFAQLIALVASPVLSRIYSPDAFAQFALYLSVISPLGVIACGRYEMAIMLPKDDGEALTISKVAIWFSVVFCIFLFVVLFFFGNFLFTFFNTNGTVANSIWWYLVPVAVFLVALYQIYYYWLNRKKNFKASAANKVFQSFGITGLSIASFKFVSFSGLIAGDFLGRLITSVYSYWQARKNDFVFSSVQKKSFRSILKKYKEFPLINMIPAFLDSVSLNFPVYIVAASFPAFVAGSFNFSRQIIGLPLLMISATVAQVFYQNLNEKKQHTLKLMPEIVGLSKVMLAVALGYILFFIFFGEKFFLFVFGNSWGDAGTYSSILCISFGVKFVISPLLMGFPVVNKLKRDSIWKVLYFFSMCLLFVLRQSDIENFLIIFSCVEAVVYLIGLFMLLDAVARFDKLSS